MYSVLTIKLSKIFYSCCLVLFVFVKPSWEQHYFVAFTFVFLNFSLSSVLATFFLFLNLYLIRLYGKTIMEDKRWFIRRCPFWETEDFKHEMSPSTAQVIHKLIANCHYDKLQPPPTIDKEPLLVYVKVYFYFLKSYEAHHLEFSVYMMLQSRFVDSRLRFDPEIYNVTEIVGTRELSQLLWKPHLYFNNDRQSSLMGPEANEVITHIYPDGTVLYTKRVQTTLFCWMKLQKFPFDSQFCTLELNSWSYNTTYLVLQWEKNYPILCRDELTLTEFTLVGDPVASESVDYLNFDKNDSGVFQGAYSSVVVTFHLQRESGFYIYDYFIPSILLVVVSWVSFWLEADAPMVSGRVVLGCSTMLTFIILAHQTGNSLPKVSYIKASEIWFIGCTAFIFGSLVEFAFVNTIYRSRRKQIGLKKVNSKYILKETLTPKAKRKELNLERSTSCPNNLNSSWVSWSKGSDLLGMELNKDSLNKSLPNFEELSEKESMKKKSKEENSLPTIMTPKEVSNWIDSRSRIIFPISFLIFNIGYWCYVYYL